MMFNIMDNATFLALIIYLTYTLGHIAVWAVKPLRAETPADHDRP